MKKVGVAILGLGVVGGGTYNILVDNKEYFKKTQDVDFTVECVLEKNVQRAIDLGLEESQVAKSIEEVVSNPNVDIVVEVIGGVEPAKTFVLKALKSGKTVVTSNKELFAKHWPELETEAKNNKAGLFFEASCVGGVPIIRTLIDGMQANNIQSIKGIINGTTNYILTKMANEGSSYEEALKEAQRLGYAEFNPTADVEGFDATYKLSILSSLAFNKKICIENVYREGITGVTKEDIAYGKELGYTLKLLGIGKNTKHGIEVRVHPTFVANSNPLASVNDSFNAVHLVGDSVGEIMLYGRGAGALPTGSAIVSDVIYAAKHEDFFYTSFDNSPNGNKQTKFVNDFTSKYFIRLSVADEPGVLSTFSGVFSKCNISISEVKQTACENGKATVIIITHESSESNVNKALAKFKSLKVINKVESVIRVED
ncbi:MAG: homoserine dehydrogenase [Clostridia bacterium]|nr:homoserine dehydrogenase [Clostridia bacterium]